jgi:spore germination protein
VDNIPHEVHFVNATTINSLAKISIGKGITGTGIWNIMNYFAQMWLVINSQYQITKLMPEIYQHINIGGRCYCRESISDLY